MINIRPFAATDSDYETLVDIDLAAWPDDPGSIENWKYRDKERNPKYLFQRFMIEIDDQIVGYASYGQSQWSFHPDKYWFHYTIHPNYLADGVDRAFYDYAMAFLTECNAAIVDTHGREDETHRVNLLAENGFKVVLREPCSQLDLTRFDPAPFAAATERAKRAGLEIYSLAELQAVDIDWLPKLYELEWTVWQDIPNPDPMTKQPLEEYQKRFKHPDFEAAGWFIAVDQGEYVGLSCTWTNSVNPIKAYTGVTGVLRSHRRKGIATTLKLRAIAYVQQGGYKLIETENEENNPMFQLNLDLGFKPVPGWMEYKKVLREDVKIEIAASAA